MKKRRFVLISFLLTCALFLSACGEKDPEKPETSQDTAIQGDLESLRRPMPLTSTPAESVQTVREDAQQTVSVVIDKGEATLIYHMDKWAQLNIFETEETLSEPLGDQSYPITGLSSPVVDACIGQIDMFDLMSIDGPYNYPVVCLLLEDGTVDYQFGNPYAYENGIAHEPFRKLSWLKAIRSLEYRSDGEGIGTMTIFATSEKGLSYDIRLPKMYASLLEYEHFCDYIVEETEVDGYIYESTQYSGQLKLNEDGTVRYLTRSVAFDPEEIFEGTYVLSLSENDPDGLRPGMLQLDLKRIYHGIQKEDPNQEPLPDKTMKATYHIDMDLYGNVKLWLSEGEPFIAQEGSDPQKYDFYPMFVEYNHYLPVLIDGDLIDSLMINAPEVKEMISLGMDTLITGDTTELGDDGVGQDIWVGTDHNEHFVFEHHYTITPNGDVYYYDPVGDGYIKRDPAIPFNP